MKRSNARILSTLLRRIGKELECLSDEALERLADSDELLLAHAPALTNSVKPVSPSKLDIDALLTQLRGIETREAGFELLQASAPSRDELVRLAKAIDLPISNRFNIKQISDGIIEATIGFRVRSAAILGAEVGAVASPSTTQNVDKTGEHLITTQSAPKKPR